MRMGDCTLSSSRMALRGAHCVRRLAAGSNGVKFTLKESAEMSAQFKLRAPPVVVGVERKDMVEQPKSRGREGKSGLFPYDV